MAAKRADVEAFVERWKNKGNENQDTQRFWIDLFQNVLGLEDAISLLRFEVPVSTAASDHAGFIDVLIPSAKTLIEQKSVDIDLSKPEMRQGQMVTPAEQARNYAQGMGISQQPRYVIACNFKEFWAYDREIDPLCKTPIWKLALEDLPKNLVALQFLKGNSEAPKTLSKAVSVEAGKIMGKLHGLVAAAFDDPDTPENHHALSVLMTRLMFLMFCEDAGLIAPDAFRNYVKHFQAGDLRKGLKDLFVWLDTPDAERDKYAEDWLKVLPYMNGGLFREKTEIPPLSEDFRHTLLVEGCQEFDWSGVSPTVFGSIFEGALSHDHRRANGQHFTSPENIHKVIDPLFMDELNAAFDDACSKPIAGGARKKALTELHERIGNISILDPAAGSGNFLTESYICLRALENKILFELADSSAINLSFEDVGDKDVLVSLKNFHGIELEDFACCVARTALWIAEKQADIDTAKVVQRVYEELPLKDYKGIIQANALRIDWNEVVPAEELDYIIGNPPFIGASLCTQQQKTDVVELFGKIKLSNSLDYVCGWYYKAAELMRENPNICAALVSTNSITQGEQVSPLWDTLKERFNVHIDFAYKTFIWNSEATDEAHVHCVIIGFSAGNKSNFILYTGESRKTCKNISPYLVDSPFVTVSSRAKPLCNVQKLDYGNKPTDDGNFILSEEEKATILDKNPEAASLIRPYLGAKEFINGGLRYCIWIKEENLPLLLKCPEIKKRVDAVRDFRLASSAAPTRKSADKPYAFFFVSHKETDYIIIPLHSSERRHYIPMGFEAPNVIASNAVSVIQDATIYDFGVLMSQFHNAWMRTVCGRLKSDYRYSGGVVYNNFVWPTPSDGQRVAVENAANKVLEARKQYNSYSLAEMYDPNNEYLVPELMKAHKELDAAVEAAYGVDFKGDEEKIVAHLFKLYAEKAGN